MKGSLLRSQSLTRRAGAEKLSSTLKSVYSAGASQFGKVMKNKTVKLVRGANSRRQTSEVGVEKRFAVAERQALARLTAFLSTEVGRVIDAGCYQLSEM